MAKNINIGDSYYVNEDMEHFTSSCVVTVVKFEEGRNVVVFANDLGETIRVPKEYTFEYIKDGVLQ